MCVNLRNRPRDHAHSGRRARSVRRPRRWLRPFIAPAVAPTPPGDGPGPVRAAPLPSARVVVVVGSCDVAPGPMQLLGWCASTAPPASTALPSRPPGAPDHGWGRAEEWPRPRPVPPPERLRRAWGESRRRRGLYHGGLADSEGSPRPAPSSGPPGGPNQGRVGGARKSKSEAMSKCEARANANSGISVASSDLKGHASGVGPYSLFCRFCRSALLRMSARRLMGRRSLPPHTRVVRVRSVPTAGSRAGSQFPSPGHGPGLSVLNKSTYKLKITRHRHTGRAQGQFPFGSRPALVPRLVNG